MAEEVAVMLKGEIDHHRTEEIKRQLHEGVLLLPPWCEAIAVDLDDYIVESGGEQE